MVFIDHTSNVELLNCYYLMDLKVETIKASSTDFIKGKLKVGLWGRGFVRILHLKN